jgi:hypothetical protein
MMKRYFKIKLILEESNLKLDMKDGNTYKNLLEPPVYEDDRDGLKLKGRRSNR